MQEIFNNEEHLLLEKVINVYTVAKTTEQIWTVKNRKEEKVQSGNDLCSQYFKQKKKGIKHSPTFISIENNKPSTEVTSNSTISFYSLF